MISATVDLIYLDPPFNSNKDYAAPVGSKAVVRAAFKDTWLKSVSTADGAHRRRAAAMPSPTWPGLPQDGRTVKGMQSYLDDDGRPPAGDAEAPQKDTGSIYLHCDPIREPLPEALMDAVPGRRPSTVPRSCGADTPTHTALERDSGQRSTMCILMYSKGPEWVWNAQYLPYEEAYVERNVYGTRDDRGRYHRIQSRAHGLEGQKRYEAWRGVSKPRRAMKTAST